MVYAISTTTEEVHILMKKTFVLLLMLALFIPSQAFAASVSTSEIHKLYFKDYNAQVKKVKAAQKAYKHPVCVNVTSLTTQFKQLSTEYNSLKRAKASKEALSQAKMSLDKAKKSLSEAKKTCSKQTSDMKKRSNVMLKKLNKYKSDSIQEIKSYMQGKSKMSSEEFSKYISGMNTYINTSIEEILVFLGAPAAG